MVDIKILIDKYPHSLGTRSQLVSSLHDLYPSEKRAVNVAMAVYDSGIATKIAGLKSIDSVLLHSFIKQLVEEFGLQEQYAAEGIETWAKAYGISVLQDNLAQQPTEQRKAIAHNPDAYAKPGTVIGSASDYELEKQAQGVIITKFKGFDEADVIIPNTIDGKKIVGIGIGAYFNCKAMKTLLISDGIEFIEDGAFANCENLSKVTFPTTLRRIGSTNHYQTLSYGSGAMPTGAFASSGVASVSLPEGLKKIGMASFSRCSELMSIDLPNTITEIEDYAFSECSSLIKVVLPEHLSKLGRNAFYRCSKLNDILFPLSLQEIGASAFESCLVLEKVILNEGLKKIGEDAFKNCLKLSKLLIPSTVTEIGDDSVYKVRNDIFEIEWWCLPRDRRFKTLSTHIKNDILTIYCYSGSYGFEYARKQGYPIQNAENFSN